MSGEITRTILIGLEPSTTYIEDMEENEYLSDYRTAEEGILFVTVRIDDKDAWSRNIIINNTDAEYIHGIVLILKKDRQVKT